MVSFKAERGYALSDPNAAVEDMTEMLLFMVDGNGDPSDNTEQFIIHNGWIDDANNGFF